MSAVDPLAGFIYQDGYGAWDADMHVPFWNRRMTVLIGRL